jgi:serine/threonine protein kinase
MAGRYEEAQVEDVLDGRYTLKRQIARGGQGAVLEAEHRVSGARVAVKTLIRPALDMEDAHARLFREAQILGAVRHPGVVSIHDAGTCAKLGPYLVLEMIEGRPLDGILLTRRTLPVGQAVAVVRQLCEALSEVHYRGIVHRDVKPANVLIEGTRVGDRVQLIDFGVATHTGESVHDTRKLTKVGELLGTVEYMAPEQLMTTSPVDARSDVYSVGALFYECLAGELPYLGPPTVVMANMIAGTKPAPLRVKRDDVPRTLEIVIMKALELDPIKRYASTAELSRAAVASFAQPVPELELLKLRDEAKAAPAANAPAGPDTASRRRQFIRAPYVTPVRVLMDKGATADGRTEDISEGGILMVMDGACGDGQRVRVRLVVPVSGRVIELEGTTKWIIKGRAQRAVGLEFIGLPDDIRGAIRSYVALMTNS